MRTAIILLTMAILGCAQSKSKPVVLTATPTPSAPGVPSHVPQGAILVRGVSVLPPAFMPQSDYPFLIIALEEYARSAEGHLRWAPQQSNGITVIFETRAQPFTGTLPHGAQILEWPTGLTRRPVRLRFAPRWATAMVSERRRVLGIPQSQTLTSDELSAIYAGQALAVFMGSNSPWLYEP